MKNRLLAGALIALGAPFLASAQCPAGVTPATFLAGKTFAFRIVSSTVSGRVAAIGTFTAFAGGYLQVNETVVDTSLNPLNTVNRLAPASGRWIINNQCTAGTAPDGSKSWIGIMLNREYFTLDITAIGAGTSTLTLAGVDDSMVLAPGPGVNLGVPVQNSTIGLCPAVGPCAFGPPTPTNAITGTARLLPGPSSCPVGLGNPLNLIKGFKYTIPLAGPVLKSETVNVFPVFNNPFAYSGDLFIDRFVGATAPVPPFTPATQAGPALGPVVPNYQTQGRYIIYPDCSGGELLLNNGRVLAGDELQLEFVFSKADFSEIYVLRDDLAFPGQFWGQLAWGIGTKQ